MAEKSKLQFWLDRDQVRKQTKLARRTLVMGPEKDIMTYIPRINLTSLIRDPQAYAKRRLNILQRVVLGRGKKAALNIIGNLLQGDKETLKLKERITIVGEDSGASTHHFYDMMGAHEIFDYLVLTIKNKDSQHNIQLVDKHAILNVQRGKEIVITKVVGRDFTRKEFIGNGDYGIQVSGKITSEHPNVFPTKEFNDFLEIMNYKGIVSCYSPYLNRFGINGLIIKGFSAPQRTGIRNVQEYSFEAIFEKPIEELQVEEDELEIALASYSHLFKEKEGWTKLTKDKLKEIADPKTFLQQSKWL